MRATWLADVARAADLYVVEEPGWQNRGYDFKGKLEGVVGHHTASSPSKNCPSISMLINGRPDLPGPLANYALCRDGVVHTIAAGIANHAGTGEGWPGITLGNKDTIGIEAENSGVGEPWPAVQMDCYVRLVAAILEEIKRGPERFCCHYEWTSRKIDPAGPWVDGLGDWYDGGTVAAQSSANTFRARVEDAMGSGMTEAQEAKLDKVLELCDEILRPKLDAVYIEVAGDDHEETLAGRVLSIHESTGAEPNVYARQAEDALHAINPEGEADE